MKKILLLGILILLTAFTAIARDLEVSVAVVADDEKTAAEIEKILSAKLNAIDGVSVSDNGTWEIKIMVTEALVPENSPAFILSTVITADSICSDNAGNFKDVSRSECERFENFGVFAGSRSELEEMCQELVSDFYEGSVER